MAKLTDVQIRNWIRTGAAQARSDGGGLTFTLSAKGTAAWVLRYRHGGRPRELTLGRYPDIGLARARELATAARAQIQQGKDVARDKQTNNAERATARTFRELAVSYMAVAFPGMAKSTVQHRRRHIEKDLLPRLGPLAARDVTTADVVTVIEVVGKRSLAVAELVFTAANEIFKHGVARHTVIANPCAGISVSAICGKRQPRLRLKLTEEELRVILPALPLIGHQNALATKILLATCTRISELAGAKWEHVDLDRAEWVDPALQGQRSRLHHPALPGGRRLVPRTQDLCLRLDLRAACPAGPKDRPPGRRRTDEPARAERDAAQALRQARRQGPAVHAARFAIDCTQPSRRSGSAGDRRRALPEPFAGRLVVDLRPARLPHRAACRPGTLDRISRRLRRRDTNSPLQPAASTIGDLAA